MSDRRESALRLSELRDLLALQGVMMEHRVYGGLPVQGTFHERDG
jgi:hypothetical protein